MNRVVVLFRTYIDRFRHAGQERFILKFGNYIASIATGLKSELVSVLPRCLSEYQDFRRDVRTAHL
jgi:hypothetical protein